jgi:hypothetical protein
VAAATALLSTQAAYAAPANSAPALDPLVSLSVLGTAQSRAAICGAGAQCVLPATAVAASATTAAAAQPYDGPPRGPGIWPLLIGLGLVVVLMAVILSGNGNGDGDLTPVSP